ncbi:MAG: hypothetical protein IJ544_09085 [Prevotella sp.]|nr:hypothetical protein [Prevotella sp.]
MKKELKIIQVEQLNEVVAQGKNWMQISYPDSNYDPIYISCSEKPSSEELNEFLKSHLLDAEKYRITYSKLTKTKTK